LHNLLSLDPGSKYIGIATYEEQKDRYTTLEITDGDYLLVWKLVMGGSWTQVICEDFTAKFISHYGITTVRVVGGVEAICMLRNIPIHRPRAQDRLPFIHWADKKLLKLNGGQKYPRDHRQSAMAHLMRFQELMLGVKVRNGN